ncbi:Ribosomal protein S4 mitochondrial [Bienertia sinuspersici]
MKKRSIKKRFIREKIITVISNYKLTRKLSIFHGNLPITKMHRRTKRTSYIPFLLNPETRLDVVRLHFCETIPQARQPISHRKVCVNNGIVNIRHFKVSHGDIISFLENYARTRGEELRRFFYIKISVEKIIGKFWGRMALDKISQYERTIPNNFWESHDLNAIQSWMHQSSPNIPVNPEMEQEVDQLYPAIARMDESSPEYQEVARISRLCESWEERIINQVRNALPQREIILQDTEDVKRDCSESNQPLSSS